MSTSYKGLNLFGSGPHRVYHGQRAHLVTLDFFSGGSGGGSTAQGLMDWRLVVRGRLVGSTEASLRTIRDAIIAQVQAAPTPGTFVDHHARQWTNLLFVRYRELGPAEKGRLWSIAYEAVFQQP